MVVWCLGGRVVAGQLLGLGWGASRYSVSRLHGPIGDLILLLLDVYLSGVTDRVIG